MNGVNILSIFFTVQVVGGFLDQGFSIDWHIQKYLHARPANFLKERTINFHKVPNPLHFLNQNWPIIFKQFRKSGANYKNFYNNSRNNSIWSNQNQLDTIEWRFLINKVAGDFPKSTINQLRSIKSPAKVSQWKPPVSIHSQNSFHFAFAVH
jgi:hypothetical protein